MPKQTELLEIIKGKRLSEKELLQLIEDLKSELPANGSEHLETEDQPLLDLFNECVTKKGESLCCDKCGSLHFAKNGKTPSGRQRYLCKDCHKTFGATNGTIFYYSKFTYDKWVEFLRATIEEKSLREISKEVGINLTSAWYNRHKLYALLVEQFKSQDNFTHITEMDETYTRLSCKGLKDPTFFLNQLKRMPREWRSTEQLEKYLANAGYELVEYCQDKERTYAIRPKTKGETATPTTVEYSKGEDVQEINGLRSKEKQKRGISNSLLCRLSGIDRNGNTLMKSVCIGKIERKHLEENLGGKFGEDVLLVTDSLKVYESYFGKNKIPLIQIPPKKHKKCGQTLARINSYHSRLGEYEKKLSQMASKYADRYEMKFWWNDKHRSERVSERLETLLELLTNPMTVLHSLTTKYKEYPFDTKGMPLPIIALPRTEKQRKRLPKSWEWTA